MFGRCIRSSLCLDQSMTETPLRLSLICLPAIFPATYRSSLFLRACSFSLCRSRLSTLQRLTVAPRKAYDYLSRQKLPGLSDFYYVTRDTSDPTTGLRSRGIFSTSEDPATGSAAGCTAAWMVRYGIAQPEQAVHILQGVEIKRPSHILSAPVKMVTV